MSQPGLINQMRAVAYREYRTRSSVGASSYLWVVLAPIAWIVVVIAAFEVLDRRIPLSTDVLTFVLSGVIPYMVFRFAVTGVIRARSGYRHVIRFLGVSPRIIFATVGVVELSNLCIVMSALVVLNWAVLGNAVDMNLPAVMSGLTLAAGLGVAFAALAVALDGPREGYTRAVPIILRPSFYLSAVFYIPEELPSSMAQIVAYNPLTHCVGLIRQGLVQDYQSLAASGLFVLGVTGVMGIMTWVRLERSALL